jgi:hypothetical protein
MNPTTEHHSETKFRKFEVKFEHPANGEDRCARCVHFIPESQSCKIVKGHIEDRDWCSKFEDK